MGPAPRKTPRLKARVHLGDDAEVDLEDLDRTKRRKLDWWVARLVDDVTVGDHIRRELIPDRLRRKYDLTNLWRLELPAGWRALYTVLTSPQHPLTVSIVRIVDHKEYDRLFGYRTS
ncbi:MAG: hypothetical protein ACT4PT_04325 [Methanobacteriota archaeon]